MFDLVNGKLRVRKWPRGRGKPKTKKAQKLQDDFRAAQKASRYFAPQIMAQIEDATRGTPLLPRDLTTMLLYQRMYCFILPNGKVAWPMAARDEVSRALDAITQTEGNVLTRGAEKWEGRPPSGGGGLSLIHDEEISSATPWVEVELPAATSAVIVQGLAVTASGSYQRAIQLGAEAAGAWLDGSADYANTDSGGARTYAVAIYPHSSPSGSARDFVAIIAGLAESAPAPYLELTRSRVGTCIAKSGPCRRIRIGSMSPSAQAGSLTGGRLLVWAL